MTDQQGDASGMRHFHTTGPVFPDRHYHVLRDEELAQIKDRIDAGQYVSLFAPRQTGKTTLFYDLRRMLHQDPRYVLVMLDFEGYVGLSESDFYALFYKDFTDQITGRLRELTSTEFGSVTALFANTQMKHHGDMQQLLMALGELLPEKRIVLLGDEFDGIPFERAEPLLLAWRRMYIQRELFPAFRVYSVALVGVKNVARWNPRRSTSPFNIADRFALHGFTEAEIGRLFEAFAADRALEIHATAVSKSYALTRGHPYLVSRLGQKLERHAADQGTFDGDDIERILKEEIVSEQNDHFDSVTAHAANHRDLLLKVLFGWRKVHYNAYNSVLSELEMYGVIRVGDDESVRIANPIDEEVILRQFAPVVNGDEHHLFNLATQYRSSGLPIENLLDRFREFIGRVGTRIIAQYDGNKEAAGQYLLFSYMDYLVRQLDGSIDMEVPSGRGRLDLIVRHSDKKVVVETKMWYGRKYVDDSMQQLKRYLRSEHAKEGYVVVFDDTGSVEDGKVDVIEDVDQRITVYYVAL